MLFRSDRKSTRLNSSHTLISLVAVSLDRKSTRLNSSHTLISYAVFCLKKKKNTTLHRTARHSEYADSAQVHEYALHCLSLCCLYFALRLSVLLTVSFFCFFFFNDTATTEIYTLSLHDALPIWPPSRTPATTPPSSSNGRKRHKIGRAHVNSSHTLISYAVFCLKKKTKQCS